MSRWLNLPIRVHTVHGLPLFFWFRGRRIRVRRILDRWREVGQWWKGEVAKEFFRLDADACWVIYRTLEDESDEQWFLYRIED